AGWQTFDQLTFPGPGRIGCVDREAGGRAEVRSVDGRRRITEVVLAGRSRRAVVTRRGPGHRHVELADARNRQIGDYGRGDDVLIDADVVDRHFRVVRCAPRAKAARGEAAVGVGLARERHLTAEKDVLVGVRDWRVRRIVHGPHHDAVVIVL